MAPDAPSPVRSPSSIAIVTSFNSSIQIDLIRLLKAPPLRFRRSRLPMPPRVLSILATPVLLFEVATLDSAAVRAWVRSLSPVVLGVLVLLVLLLEVLGVLLLLLGLLSILSISSQRMKGSARVVIRARARTRVAQSAVALPSTVWFLSASGLLAISFGFFSGSFNGLPITSRPKV